MARFLFVVPPFEGHVNPTVSVASQLISRGHTVAWAAHPTAVQPLLPDGSLLLPLDEQIASDLFAATMERSRRVRGLESVKFLFEEVLVPLARVMLPGVAEAVDAFRPDVIISDQQAFAGGIVARQRGFRWASFVTTSAGILDPFEGLPKVRVWLSEQLAALEQDNGLPKATGVNLSPYMVVVFSTPALLGSSTFPPNFHFVGPSLSDRPSRESFPWEWLRDVPRVLVTLGTVNAERGDSFFATAMSALGDQPLQVILVAPPSFAGAASNILVRARIPQLDVIRHVQAVVCHGGHNTVCEALAHARPLVITPIKDDQTLVAQQVANAGAGIRLKFRRLAEAELREAVWSVLQKNEFRIAAKKIGDSFLAAGGASRAARLVEELS